MRGAASILAVALLLTPIAAQQARYWDPVFANVDVQSDLAYGSAVNRFTGTVETLRLDLYAPRGDSVAERPAIVVVHGGGFQGGDKAGAQFRRLCTDFAQRGYVATSINYRLKPQGAPITPQVIQDAVHDFKASMRWLRRNAAGLRVDVERIACLGSSAGAITCVEAAYADHGEGQSGNPGLSSAVHAVVDLWGMMQDPTDIDAGEAPLCIVHGTNDPVVPYSGGLAMYSRALAIGVPVELHPIQGAGHAPWVDFFRDHSEDTVAFSYQHLRLGQCAGLAARPGYASPGGIVLDSHGVMGDLVFLALGDSATPRSFGDLGTLCLDPGGTVLSLPAFQIPAGARIGSVSTSLLVPGGLAGSTIYWQAVHLGAAPRWLTNCVTTTF